jgi:zinc transport system ATP-binding protein
VPGPETVLDVRDVSFAYGDTSVLDHVSCAVHAGEFVALAGGNGAGKSTLLRVLLGLLHPTTGSVALDRTRVGYVPQRPFLSESLPATVREVVASGRLGRGNWWRRPSSSDAAAVAEALGAVDLLDASSHRSTELSGGQQQRVLIAKAMVNDPDLLILDEPIAGVDAASQDRFRDALVSRIHRGRAVLLVSHELSAVADALDRVVLLAHGHIEFDGPPADLEREGVSLGFHRHDLPAWLENRL